MSERFRIQPTGLAGVSRVDRLPIVDARGRFERLYCAHELEPLTKGRPIVQINRSLTRHRGAVRGLHFQRPPCAETKLVVCLRGQVFDVAVDLRAGSSTFLHWHAERLDGEGEGMLVIPEGCAHGFQALSDDCELLYLHTAPYAPEAEGGLHPADPRLAIPWPLPFADISARDAGHVHIDASFQGIRL